MFNFSWNWNILASETWISPYHSFHKTGLASSSTDKSSDKNKIQISNHSLPCVQVCH